MNKVKNYYDANGKAYTLNELCQIADRTKFAMKKRLKKSNFIVTRMVLEVRGECNNGIKIFSDANGKSYNTKQVMQITGLDSYQVRRYLTKMSLDELFETYGKIKQSLVEWKINRENLKVAAKEVEELKEPPQISILALQKSIEIEKPNIDKESERRAKIRAIMQKPINPLKDYYLQMAIDWERKLKTNQELLRDVGK